MPADACARLAWALVASYHVPVDIQQLRYVVAVAEELHFRRAAERLHMTAPPLSRRIRELEHELKAELFIRGYHRVELTPFGAEFAKAAADVVLRFDALRRMTRPRGVESRCSLRLGAPPLCPPEPVDRVIEIARRILPDLDLRMALAPSAELLTQLVAGDIDLVVCQLPTGYADLRSHPLAYYPLAVGMRADDELARRDALAISDISGRTVLVTSSAAHPPAMRPLVTRLRREAGPQKVVELPHNDMVQVAEHVHRSGCLTFVPLDTTLPLSRAFDGPRFAVVPLEHARIGLRIGVAWRPADEAQDAFVKALSSELMSVATWDFGR